MHHAHLHFVGGWHWEQNMPPLLEQVGDTVSFGVYVLVATGSIYFLMLVAARDLRVCVANLHQNTIC